VLERARGDISLYEIKGPFWLFDTKQHQQEILEQIAKKLNRKALVVYASPAFDTLDLLYNYTSQFKIVENSNFVKVDKMAGHHQWNYDEPGTHGLAQSEPEYIEDRTFAELLGDLEESYVHDSNANEEILMLHKITFTTCKDLIEANPLARFIVNIHKRFTELHNQEDKDIVSLIPFVSLLATFSALNVTWLVVGENGEPNVSHDRTKKRSPGL
jgi:hypothetical protein